MYRGCCRLGSLILTCSYVHSRALFKSNDCRNIIPQKTPLLPACQHYPSRLTLACKLLAMSSTTPTYIPSPNWDIPADSDIVVLGRLIKDPKNPESRVPGSAYPIPLPKIYEAEKTDWQTTLDQLRSGTIGIWAKCLHSISGQLSFSQLKSSVENHKFDTLETRYILPDDNYVEKALQDAGAQAYFQVHNWRKPVYLITGIKIARGASVHAESNTERSAQASLQVDGTLSGAPSKAGPEGTLESKMKRGISYGGSTDYIFAYRLMKIQPKKGGQKFTNRSYVKGAVFEKGEEDKGAEVKVGDAFDTEEEVSLGFPDILEQIEKD